MDTNENQTIPDRAITLSSGSPHPCPYLPGRQAEEAFLSVSSLDGAIYQAMMDMGFRRSGHVVYRPNCADCRECVQLRVPVDRFSPSRSQRRVRRRNTQIEVEIDSPACTEEKWRIYADYLSYQHQGTIDDSIEAFKEFLYDSPTETIEFTYRLHGRIVAVGIADLCPDCLSSVYLYFDPVQARRSLGTLAALIEIEECRRRDLAYWYAGFLVRQCGPMNYKAAFKPYELLRPGNRWHPSSDAQ